MSRIGKKPVAIPSGVKAAINANTINIEGPKGKLSYSFAPGFKVEVKDNAVSITRPSDAKQDKSTHGLIRSLINNMIIGVTEGYKKELEITGVGFKAAVQGKVVNMVIGYSHPINYNIPDQIKVTVEENTKLTVEGPDKMLVGKVASELRAFYPPEPYKGKGVRYVGEHVQRKEGKTVQ